MTKRTRRTSEVGIGVLGVSLAAGAAAYIFSKQNGDGAKARHSPDDAPGRTARRSFGEYDVVGRSVTIGRPREEIFAFWRDFSNLSQVMENVVAVRANGDRGRSVWTIKAPLGGTVDIETEIVREEPGKLIAWRSIAGSDIDTEGRVTFKDAPGQRGTRVSATIAYKPPAGEIGRAAAKLFLREPAVQARHDLKRLKMLMEAGEIATSARRADQTRAASQSPKQEEFA